MSKPRLGGVRHATAAALLVMGVVFAAARVAANPDVEGHDMLDPEGRYAALYDPDDVEEIVGQVLRIERVVEAAAQGPRALVDGVPVIVAAHVRTATATLVLRRADGTPIWGVTRYRDRR